MKIAAVYITLDSTRFQAEVRSRYQLLSNYLSLFISDWIKSLGIDLGAFNRIVFEEGSCDDLTIVGDRAFVVSIAEEFSGFEAFSSEGYVHKYFVRKYIEGFRRFDKKYNLSLADELRIEIDRKFAGGLKYEVKLKSIKKAAFVVNLVHRYGYSAYELVVRLIDKDKVVIKEIVLFSCDPDPFVVHYEINRIEVVGRELRVINKIRETVLTCDLDGLIPMVST